MFKKLTHVMVTALALGASSQAFAGWQYTKWGMTPDEVVASSQGKVFLGEGEPGDKLKGSDNVVRAVGTYSAGTRDFRAVFYFKGDKLSFITLLPTTPGCGSLWADLRARYGEPLDESNRGVVHDARWHSSDADLRIFLTDIGTYCALKYYPLKTAEAMGL